MPVYYSIIQYITVYSTAHYNISSQTHVPPASFLAVTLSASLLPTCRSCLPSIDPTWIALQDKKEREKESKWRGGGCEGGRGGHQFHPYLFISQKDIWPSRVATASSNPSGLKASVITAERNWEEVPLLHSKVHLENNIGSWVTHHRWYGRESRCFPFVQTRPTVSPSYPRSQTQGGLARQKLSSLFFTPQPQHHLSSSLGLSTPDTRRRPGGHTPHPGLSQSLPLPRQTSSELPSSTPVYDASLRSGMPGGRLWNSPGLCVWGEGVWSEWGGVGWGVRIVWCERWGGVG